MTLRLGAPRDCARCGNHRPHKARGLCNPCYTTAYQSGTKEQWARDRTDATMRADRLEDFLWLVDNGTPPSEAAARIGHHIDTIRRWEAS